MKNLRDMNATAAQNRCFFFSLPSLPRHYEQENAADSLSRVAVVEAWVYFGIRQRKGNICRWKLLPSNGSKHVNVPVVALHIIAANINITLQRFNSCSVTGLDVYGEGQHVSLFSSL
jgi:hypothetical protein